MLFLYMSLLICENTINKILNWNYTRFQDRKTSLYSQHKIEHNENNNQDKGSLINYVTQIWAFFDPPPPPLHDIS